MQNPDFSHHYELHSGLNSFEVFNDGCEDYYS
jgi:hypothetical protein